MDQKIAASGEQNDMRSKHLRGRALKKEIGSLIQGTDITAAIGKILSYPPKMVINPLFGLLLSTDSRVRWNAVVAMGAVVKDLSLRDMESARVIVRRLMWQLNDESGGIGWGCPEAMGEILAQNRKLAEEFSAVLISYIREDGNFLEHEPLQSGAIWAVGRLAGSWPDLTKGAWVHVMSFLESRSPQIRGMAIWALGELGDPDVAQRLNGFLNDTAELEIFRRGKLVHTTVGQLAKEALSRL